MVPTKLSSKAAVCAAICLFAGYLLSQVRPSLSPTSQPQASKPLVPPMKASALVLDLLPVKAHAVVETPIVCELPIHVDNMN
jgi:hypothetical protein